MLGGIESPNLCEVRCVYSLTKSNIWPGHDEKMPTLACEHSEYSMLLQELHLICLDTAIVTPLLLQVLNQVTSIHPYHVSHPRVIPSR
jgi:hypothetical protein